MSSYIGNLGTLGTYIGSYRNDTQTGPAVAFNDAKNLIYYASYSPSTLVGIMKKDGTKVVSYNTNQEIGASGGASFAYDKISNRLVLCNTSGMFYLQMGDDGLPLTPTWVAMSVSTFSITPTIQAIGCNGFGIFALIQGTTLKIIRSADLFSNNGIIQYQRTLPVTPAFTGTNSGRASVGVTDHYVYFKTSSSGSVGHKYDWISDSYWQFNIASGVGGAIAISHLGDMYATTDYSQDTVFLFNASLEPSTVVIPNKVTNISPISSKNFGDEVSISWDLVTLPSQPNGIILDVNKIFYEVSYFANGINRYVVASGLDTTSYVFKIITGESSSNKIGIRAYVLYEGKKYYSDYVYTNTFITNVPSSNTTFPNALSFNGIDSYTLVSNRIVPTTGPWTVEFSFKTTQDNGYILSIDNGTNHVLLCQLSSGELNVIIDGQGAASGPFNDGKIHHVGIVQDNGLTNVYVDGIFQYSISRAVPTFSPASLYLGMMGYDYTSNNKYTGILGLPRFWNIVRSVQQLKDYRGIIVPDDEPGLIDYLVFDPSTGLVNMKKNSYTITNNSISWAYLFIPLENIVLPFPYDSQRGENLIYLRNIINSFRVNNGLDVKTWTDPVIIKGYTPIKAVHWNEVENSINTVYENLGQPISSPEVKEQFEEEIIPKNKKFPIKNLNKRMKNILKGLKNE